MAAWSIAARITFRTALVLTLGWALAIGAAMFAVRYELNEVFDSTLEEMGQYLLAEITEREAAVLAAPGPPIMRPAAQHDEYVTYIVADMAGRVRVRSHQAAERPLRLPLTEGFETVGGQRFYTEFSPDGRYAIQLAERQGHRSHAIERITLGLALPLALLLPLLMLAVRRVVAAGLSPVAELGAQVARRDGQSLTPITMPSAPRELGVLVEDINRLLLRLSSALESERRFVADSAHELRTPVAAALAQAQLLADQLGPVHAAQPGALAIARDMGRLGARVEKLLQLARAEAGIGLSREPVDLVQVTSMICDEFAHRPGAERLQLVLGPNGTAPVWTDLDAAAIAVRNLIENGLRHGAPDQPVRVIIATDATTGGSRLCVQSGGPALPPEILAGLPARFRRHATHNDGSGLGLSIVDALMRQMGGGLALSSPAPGQPDGFEAALWFPATGPTNTTASNN